MDLGECPKVHDLALRADYVTASRRKDYFYDIDVSKLESFLVWFYVCFKLLEIRAYYW